MDEAAKFRFKGRYIQSDDRGYYYRRWDEAIHVSVLASTKGEAEKKLWAMLGKCRFGWHWVVQWDSIDEVAEGTE